ncbi:MAG: hypothetical protein GWN79_27470, partial [Actinobacteria bacterium]|nr:hypothetical protein [Actinomycetota bacterium]NIS36785.1 hypothetical protein [Actinomycetota bacterium]NIU22549.1 hypothetical protein [Actinomycetota bacterium]NIU71274.1 hypothetical protein [Actinomycetota bacterium]NIW33226.1 hypothetical protein [Actinomycetota bacterium]
VVAPAASTVVARVNAGGPSIASIDGGPDWSVDADFVNTSGGVFDITSAVALDATIPAGVPSLLFQSERFDGPAAPAMSFRFPV